MDSAPDTMKQAGEQNDTENSSPGHTGSNRTERTEPIHPLISEVKLSPHMAAPTYKPGSENSGPWANANLTQLHPVTGNPFSLDELRAHKIESLLGQYPTAELALQAREDTVKEVRRLIDENEEKNKRIDHELEEKEKTREIERKVYASGRKLGKDT